VSSAIVAFPVSPTIVQPLSPGRYKVQFTATTEFHDKLERLQALMGSQVPGGDLAAVIEQAVPEKLERLEARRFARTKAVRKGPAETGPSRSARHVPAEPRAAISPSSRHIPATVRRAVYERDGGRCRYLDEQGRRCQERNRLEFHHRHPFGLGGDHSVANVRLMCRAHNAYLAECDYGSEAMARHRDGHRRARASRGTAG
jgi:5-methylcytosine-specific restriction endonuclease McrA